MSLEHLDEKVKYHIEQNADERILNILKPKWIGYSRAKTILKKLDDLSKHPKIHRMPNLLIVGDTNNGKTMIIDKFERMCPASDNSFGDEAYVPLLTVEAPSVPDEGRFYNRILDTLFCIYKPRDSVDQKLHQIITLLRRIRLKLLVIDEIQHILFGSMMKQRQLLNAIKSLGNQLQIPIIGVGTREAFNALQSDPQLSNRFEPVILPKWKLDEEYLRLLVSFERVLPLKNPSNLIEPNTATKILTMSEGTIGAISTLLKKCAQKAIETGTESITMDILNGVDWTLPSEMKWKG